MRGDELEFNFACSLGQREIKVPASMRDSSSRTRWESSGHLVARSRILVPKYILEVVMKVEVKSLKVVWVGLCGKAMFAWVWC